MDGLQYSIPPAIFIFIAFTSLLADCAELDTISANQPIKDGNTIISNGDMYELGFFSPGKSKTRYLGIWYKKISYGTVVWVANRETPLTDTSGTFKVTKNGSLLILSGNNTQIWSSNSRVSVVSNLNLVAQLLDTGNLVVWDKNRTDRNIIWQSFDYPSDTFLPGMDTACFLQMFMTSWKSPDDPSPGEYNNIVDTNGYPQIFARKGSVLLYRLGPWNGVGFSGFATEIPNPVFSDEFIIVNQKEIHHSYKLTSSVVQRRVITWDGKLLILNWVERIRDWIVYIDAGVDNCGRFALCGSYGSCSMNKRPACSCMKGFEPKNQEQWDASDWSSGCQHKRSFDCGETDGFMKISGVKLPDTRFSSYNVSMTLAECEIACRMNCNCTAYANIDIRNGGLGCLLWFTELMDMREYDENHDIFVRMAASELEGYQSDSNKRKGVLIVVLSISSALFLLSAVVYVCRKRMKRFQGDREYALNKKKNTSAQTEHLDDTPFFSLDKVAKATNNFNDSNKIGEGGFGPVYKGVLDDGREIAVKRLSESSQQGIDEFTNELNSIAKFQHRNLVKLLRYCIHGIEMILIYEYMANKSLDSFLFDETKSLVLDWPQRFGIIHGIARGILYLHQDSRLQIIHRDLKAVDTFLQSMHYTGVSL